MFYAQRNAGYFSVISYFFATLIADFPVLFAQTSMFSIIVYSMTSTECYLIMLIHVTSSVQTCEMVCFLYDFSFSLYSFCNSQWLVSLVWVKYCRCWQNNFFVQGRAWITFIANIVPNESMAITLAIVCTDIFWYFQGYFRPVHEMTIPWRWINYISFFNRIFQVWS